MPVSPTYPGVYVEELPSGVRTITGVSTAVAAFVGRAQAGPLNEPTVIHNFGDYERVFGGLAKDRLMSYAVHDYFLNGGSTAIIVRCDEPQSALPGSQVDKTGLYALEKVDLFTLLCLPDADETVVAEAAVYCERRRALLIVDPPAAWTTKANVDVTALNCTSQNAAVYFPRIQKRDPLDNNALRSFPPCGAVAGMIARTDAQRGIWKAPAGTDAGLVGVVEPGVSLTDLECGDLNPKGVNCLRSLPPHGTVAWGARTLKGSDQAASEWKYVPVRRLALYVEESLFRGTQWAVFEPNDEPLWSQLRLNIGAFMHDLFRQGAFQGSSPKEAYFVKCDHESTTQNDIDKGIVNVVVGFAPLKPAEFVILKFQQIAGQA